MTEKIYLNDSYCKEFKATVISCVKIEKGYEIVLSKTAFFPMGGGQAADRGTIDEIPVLDVQIKDGTIIHTVESPIPAGKEIVGKIDWDLRFSRMQSHAGEHIVSGIVHSLFDYSNVGFHMSESGLMTVDFDGPLTADDIKKVELLSNHAVYDNLKISASYPVDCDNVQYRSKIEIGEDLRLITIEGVDCCACCAPHPSRTGEIGLIKIVNAYPYKQGTRVEMLAGICALYDYIELNSANKELMGHLSASRTSVNEAVQRQSEQLAQIRAENQQMSKRLALLSLNPQKAGECVYSITEGFSYDDLRFCANSLTDSGVKMCVLLSEADEGFIYVVASKSEDVREKVKELNKTFSGKGGGKPDYAQGKLVAQKEELERKIKEMLK